MIIPFSLTTTIKPKTGVLIFVFFLVFYFSCAQTQKSGSLTGYIYSVIDNLPGAGDDDYSAPTAYAYGQWKEMILTLLAGNYSLAATRAVALAYDLVEYTDGQNTYWLLEKKTTGNNFWGTYIFNPEACRKVVIQCPHPRFDYNTGKEGIYVFQQTHSLFYCVSGTNRCNSGSYSSCSGTATVCSGSSEPYRISDPAHNTNSIFQATTVALHESDSTLIFIQLHGFAKGAGDPYVIMSNGTRDTPSPDYISVLKEELVVADPLLDFRTGHIDLDWNRLLAFTNVQGRYLNGSNYPCTTDATIASGTFIHIEQEKSRLRADSTKWEKMTAAVSNTFTCTPLSVNKITEYLNVDLFPNPTRGDLTIDIKGRSYDLILKVFSVTGEACFNRHIPANVKTRISLSGPQGLYLFVFYSPETQPVWMKVIKK